MIKKLLVGVALVVGLNCFGAVTNTNYLYSVSNMSVKLQFDWANNIFTNVVVSRGAGPGFTNSYVGGFKFYAGGSSNYYLLNASNAVVMIGDVASSPYAPYVSWAYSNGQVFQYSSTNLIQPGVLGRPENPYQLYGTNLYMNGRAGLTTNIIASQGGSRSNLLMFSSGVLTNVINNY